MKKSNKVGKYKSIEVTEAAKYDSGEVASFNQLCILMDLHL